MPIKPVGETPDRATAVAERAKQDAEAWAKGKEADKAREIADIQDFLREEFKRRNPLADEKQIEKAAGLIHAAWESRLEALSREAQADLPEDKQRILRSKGVRDILDVLGRNGFPEREVEAKAWSLYSDREQGRAETSEGDTIRVEDFAGYQDIIDWFQARGLLIAERIFASYLEGRRSDKKEY